MQGIGVIPILKKNCNPFALFPFINTPSKMIKWKFLYIPLTPFYYNPLFLPTQPPFNQSFFWKGKVKHTVVDITCFLQDTKSSVTKHKRVFWKRLTEPVKHLSCSLLQKKVNGLQLKTISAKKSTLDVWEGPKEYQLLLWWILPQILTSLNLKVWYRIPAPSVITHPPHPRIKLPRIQIIKIGFRKLSILPKFWEWRKSRGSVGGGGSSYLCHYDALRTKIDMWPTP